jgi:hypothetical protein
LSRQRQQIAQCRTPRSPHSAESRPIRNATTSELSRSSQSSWAGPLTPRRRGVACVPAASDRDRRSAADHQCDRDGAAVLLQGDTRPAGDDAASGVRLRDAQAAARALARGGAAPCSRRARPIRPSRSQIRALAAADACSSSRSSTPVASHTTGQQGLSSRSGSIPHEHEHDLPRPRAHPEPVNDR